MTQRGNGVEQSGDPALAGWALSGNQGLRAGRWALILLLTIVTATGICRLRPAGASSAASEDAGSQGADTGCPQVPPTPYFTIAYGTARVGGQDAPEGAVVQALSPRQTVAGCIEVTTPGHYGAMFVFGEDSTAQPPIAGMRPGEPVAFRLGGNAAVASPALVWASDQQFHEVALSAGPAEVCYSLSTSASPAAGGSVGADMEPNCTGDLTKYAAGTQVQLTASPNQGYSFDDWSGDASGSTNPTTITMDQDHSVTANFSQQCYSLNTTASPTAGGSVDADVAPDCSGDPSKYAAGTQVQLTAIPSLGYSFDNWSGDASGSTNPTTITMDQDHSVTANFSQQCYSLNTTAGPTAGGSVDADVAPDCSGDPSKYAAGTQVQLTAIPSLGYSFDNWSGDASGSANPTTVTMDQDRTVTANFLRCYTLSTDASPADGGSVEADIAPNCGSDPSKYAAGTQVQLTGNPNLGYSFASWSGDASGSANPTTVTMDQDRSATANFSQQCYALSTGASPAAGGSVAADIAPNCTGDTAKYAAGTQVQLTANPTQGYSFDQWNGDASGGANPATVTMDQDRSVTANFLPCYALSASASPGGSGSVQTDIAPNCGGDPNRYAAGTQVQLTASPAPGYIFEYWSGDAAGSANPITLTMDQDLSVVAHFQQGYPAFLPLMRRGP